MVDSRKPSRQWETTSQRIEDLEIMGKSGSGSRFLFACKKDRSTPEGTQMYTREITKEITAPTDNRSIALHVGWNRLV